MVGGAGVLRGNVIAAGSELKGLRQVYTANNLRVRSVKARIEEFSRPLRLAYRCSRRTVPGNTR
jgi:hypothetical protein